MLIIGEAVYVSVWGLGGDYINLCGLPAQLFCKFVLKNKV